MTIPFLDLFKKLTGRVGSGAAVAEAPKAAPRVIRPKKTDNERLSKTVMPNSTRSLSTPPPDPFRSAAATASVPRSSMPLELGAKKITTSAAARPRASQLPPALARALEPKVERTLSLRVADLIDAIPAGFIKPIEILDTNATVLLKASEIEKGMPEKHPTIALPSLYQQVPEIFLRSVRPDDDTRVDLPYEKVLEQFQTASVRADQERDPTVPHVDTPILKATIEDSERFGTKIAPIETSFSPATPVKHATAESIADAEPDATPVEAEAPLKMSPSGQRVISLHSPELTSKTDAPKPSADQTESFEEVSPNGTGASASERVPASSGPPVPTPLPFNPDLAKIAFELPREKPATKEPEKKAESTTSPPPPGIQPPVISFEASEPSKSLTLQLEKLVAKYASPEASKTAAPATVKVAPEPAKAVPSQLQKTAPEPIKTIPSPSFSISPKIQAEPSKKDAPSISFSLKSVLQNLPAFQLAGDIAAVGNDERFALPLDLVEPQLATGRVSIPADVFQKALPEKHRSLFQLDVAKTAVVLPLEEVLKNLPATVLKLRDDQETTSIEEDFETPFFLKAQEDARRFAPKEQEAKPVAKPKVESAAATIEVPAKPAVEKVDPKEIIAQANALAGVKACAITFSDGLSLAGELPEEMHADGLCAMAPSVLERITQHINQAKLGELIAMTLYAKNSAVSFFARGNVCLTAVHEKALEAESRMRLAELIEKLSKTYAQPETSNVDH